MKSQITELRGRIDKLEVNHARTEGEIGDLGRHRDIALKEIQSLRDSRHDINNKVSAYGVQLNNHDTVLTKLTDTIEMLGQTLDNNYKEWQKFSITMKVGITVALTMGGGFISFVVFVGGELLGWWK